MLYGLKNDMFALYIPVCTWLVERLLSNGDLLFSWSCIISDALPWLFAARHLYWPRSDTPTFSLSTLWCVKTPCSRDVEMSMWPPALIGCLPRYHVMAGWGDAWVWHTRETVSFKSTATLATPRRTTGGSVNTHIIWVIFYYEALFYIFPIDWPCWS